MDTRAKMQQGFIIALIHLTVTTLTVWASAPTSNIPATELVQQSTVGVCQQRPLPDLSNIATQPPAQIEPLSTVPATDPQLELLREATFLLGEGDRLYEDGAVNEAREKWLQAAAAYQNAGDQLGESDAYLRLADSYPPFEVALDPALMNQVMGYYEAAFFASAAVYETLIQKELTYDQDLLAEAETLYDQGRAFYEAGNCQEAQPLFEDARDLFREAEFGSGELRVLITMARCQFNPDDPLSSINALTTLLDALLVADSLPLGTPTTRRYLEGVDLFEQGQWEEAREALSEVEEQYQAAGETAAAAHATQDLAGAYAAAGDLPQAETLYLEAVAVYETTPDEYALYNQAGVHHNLGNIATLTGRYQEAIVHYNTAVELWRAIGEPAQEVASLTGLGWVLRETGDYSQALATLESAQAMQQRLSPDPETEGDLLNNIALVYISLARYDQALGLLNQALVLRRQLPHRQKELETLSNIATVEANLGQFAAALNTYETVLTIAEETGATRIETATQVNIASIHVQQGRYQQGLAAYLEMLPVYRQTEERPSIAMLEADIGAAYRSLGNLDNARSYLGTALETFEDIGNFEGAANTRNNLGNIALQSGNLLEAQTCLEQTLSLWQALDNPAAASGALGNLAWVAAVQGDFTAAISRGEEALTQQNGRRADEARLRLLLGLSHLGLGETALAKTYGQQVLDIADNLDDPALTMVGQVLLGTAYYAEGERPLAYEHTQQAITALEQLQGIITVAELKASFLGQLADAYTLAVLLAADLGYYEDAFHYAEEARARAFLDQISNGPVDFRAQADADLLAQERDLQAQIVARHQQLAVLHNRPDDEQDAETVTAVQDELARLEAAHADLLVELKVRAPDVAAWLSADVDSLANIQSRLDEQTTLVEYYVTDEKTLAFIIARDDFTAVPLPEATAESLITAVTDLYQWLNRDNPHPKPLRDLYNWLVAPLIDDLNTPLVGIIPHQTLHYVPFTALTDGENYLGGQHTLFVLPSASSLGFIQENVTNLETAAQPALIFGNPETGDSDFPSLVFAAAEATAVADLLGASAYTETEAQETRFWSDVQGAEVVHLAAHGSYNVSNPLYSAIHLSPNIVEETSSIGKGDGRLEVHEVYDLDLRATQMVVLSACQTNVAEVNQANQVISAGDEIVGLTRAFFAAGTPTVISSLWTVDDAATEELMAAFYRYWASGMGKSEALQMAQRELQTTHPGPFYWAGFVLSGDYGRVGGSLEPSPPPPPSAPENTPTAAATTATPEPGPEGNGRGFGLCSSAIILPLLLIGFGGGYYRKRLHSHHSKVYK
jgi:CHAT domain-containing protein